VTFVQRQRLRAASLLRRLSGGNPSRLDPPRLVQIEVTNRCDLFCRTCTRLKLPDLGDMGFEDFTRLVDALGPVDTLWLSGQGEPLLHPDLPRMVRYCAGRRISHTVLHTNAMQLHGRALEELSVSGLGELRVSLDGGTAAPVEYLREGADWERILANTTAWTKLSPTEATFYVLLNQKNHDSIPLLPAVARRCGVRRINLVETVPFRDTSTEREVYDRREYQFTGLPAATRRRTLTLLRRAAREHGVKVSIDLKWHRRHCQEPWRKLYIDFRGNVTPCCRIHHEVMVGNILTDGLDRVWNGPALQAWRRSILNRGDHPRICVERCNLGIGPDR
jgi:molybdenum cofactor biosynthesis enzyme MoaA